MECSHDPRVLNTDQISNHVYNGKKKLGLIVGGSGFIGGTIVHYFKTRQAGAFELLAPNSKRLSIREPEDIRSYLKAHKPDFIINCALPPLNSGPQLSYQINYLGSINLARASLALGVPYIHFSSGALLPMVENVTETDALPLSTHLPFYPRAKLMAEMTLNHMHQNQGLDCTIIRPGIVYGPHDHKIQGFQRLLFSIATQSMMFLLTRPGVKHSYTNTEKIPPFVHHILEHREEFSGQTYHFVDPEPVELCSLMLSIRNHLRLKRPRRIFVPYFFSALGRISLTIILRLLRPLGFDGRLPQEIMFLDKFYQSQIFSVEKLRRSSFGIVDPEVTVFSRLPEIISYYIMRWQQFNLIPAVRKDLLLTAPGADLFEDSPADLLQGLHQGRHNFLSDFDSLK